jgi:pimeloyl-ACP methyl ester carboxylesterase
MVCTLNNPGTLGAIIAMNEALTDAEDDAFFAGIKAPTIIIEGEEDRSGAQVAEVQKRIPNCELVFVPKAGHACNLEAPWDYDRIATGFLQKHGL